MVTIWWNCNYSSWLDRIQNSDTSTSHSTNQAFLFKFTFMLCEDSVLHSFFVASEFKWGKFRPNMAERSQRRDQFFRNKPNVWPHLRPQNALCPDIRCCCKINIPHTCRQISLSVKDIRETSNNALHFCETWIKKCRDCSCYVIQLGGGVEVGGFSTKHWYLKSFNIIFISLENFVEDSQNFWNQPWPSAMNFDANHLLCRIPTYDFNSMTLSYQ